MEFHMSNDEIIQEVEVYLCKCKVHVEDKRTRQTSYLTIFYTLSKSEEEPRPIVERILGRLGYYFYGFHGSPEFATFTKDADALFKTGNLSE